MNDIKVSIIMPVYGVEKYLANSINSVLNQTYKSWELILVDDKSPDGCPAICDSFAEKDKRIKVIHKPENQGLGFARNTGLDSAQGEFIYFIDSDDYIEPMLLEKALAAMKDETQLVIFGINRVHEDTEGNITKTERLTPEGLSSTSPAGTAEIFAMLNRAKVFPFAWNKLYRKSFLDICNARFESTKLIEDFLFNIALFSEASHITVIEDNLYNYRKPAHETLVSAYSPDFFGLCKRKYTLEKSYLEKIGGDSEENLQLIYFSYVKHLISVFLKNNSPKAGLTKKEQMKKIKEVLGDDMTTAVLSEYKPQGIVMKTLAIILKTRIPAICLLIVLLAGKMLSN